MSRKFGNFKRDIVQNLVGSTLGFGNHIRMCARTLENTSEAWNGFYVGSDMIFHQDIKGSKKLYKSNSRPLWRNTHG